MLHSRLEARRTSTGQRIRTLQLKPRRPRGAEGSGKPRPKLPRKQAFKSDAQSTLRRIRDAWMLSLVPAAGSSGALSPEVCAMAIVSAIAKSNSGVFWGLGLVLEMVRVRAIVVAIVVHSSKNNSNGDEAVRRDSFLTCRYHAKRVFAPGMCPLSGLR